MFAGKKSAQIREILISESAWEEMTCLFAPSLDEVPEVLTELTAKEARKAKLDSKLTESVKKVYPLSQET